MELIQYIFVGLVPTILIASALIIRWVLLIERFTPLNGLRKFNIILSILFGFGAISYAIPLAYQNGTAAKIVMLLYILPPIIYCPCMLTFRLIKKMKSNKNKPTRGWTLR